MRVWICIPSIRPGGGTLPEWKRKGYKVAVLRQGARLDWPDMEIPTPEYKGWAASINYLVRGVLERDPEMSFCVGGGDDTLADPNHDPGRHRGPDHRAFLGSRARRFADAARPGRSNRQP
jgi:hypothetical protein